MMNSGVTTFYKSIYSIVEYAKEHGLVIYGAGFWGEISYKIFSLFNVTPSFFCDDDINKQGTFFHDGDIKIPIISLEEAASKFPDAVYFAAINNSNGANGSRVKMNSRLKQLGLLSEYSGFHPSRYLFLLEGGLDALENPSPAQPQDFNIEHLNNMIIFNHMGGSGSVLFNTLVDSHPNIITTQNIGYGIVDVYINRLQFLTGKELVLETASQLQIHFITKYFGMTNHFFEKYFVDKNGTPESRIYIDSFKFISSLLNILENKGRVSFAVLIKAIFAAYANSIGKKCEPQTTYWIFCELHQKNFDYTTDKLIRPEDFSRLEYLFIIREPIQHLFSCINRSFAREGEDIRPVCKPEPYKQLLFCDLGIMLEKRIETCGKQINIVRFEDVKLKTRETMEAVCSYYDIPFDECMMNTTVNGIPVYFPASHQDNKKVISSNDMTAVNRNDFSKLLSSYDIFRLNLAFANFKHAYGYECDVPHYSEFSQAFLQELYKHPFRFEETIDSMKKEAFDIGILSPDEAVIVHSTMTDIILYYMENSNHELITNILKPIK